MRFSKYRPSKEFISGLRKKAGRNHNGRITVRHQGGGNKQLYRVIDWSRKNELGITTNFEYDPNRSAFLAKIYHQNEKRNENTYSYILAPKGLRIFDKIHTIKEKNKSGVLSPGDATYICNFEFGDLIHNVESIPGKGALFARSAGTFCQILQHASTASNIRVRLPSGSNRLIPSQSLATLGMVAGEDRMYRNLEKAGRSRWLNKRPSVRGVAMNPVDHPHGGGQGKTKGGRPSVTPWSLPTKGQPTRNKRKKNKFILTPRKK